MIGVSSAGRSFRAIATYLAAGRTGVERDRVAWSAGRNLPTDDPELAGVCMRATAAQNGRVERPVYHLVLSFDPTDGADRTTMEQVADRVLARLGLAAHQAVIVAHRDRAHAHVHILVNRVHPETGRVAPRDFDYHVVQTVLRAEEARLGLRQVPGTLAPTVPMVRTDVRESALTGPTPVVDRSSVSGAHADMTGVAQDVPPALQRGAQRTGAPTFVEQVRAQLPALREATSWDAFQRMLAQHGWRVERQRTGLVVTDGTCYARASRVSIGCSMPALERRFGVSYDAYANAHANARIEGRSDVRDERPVRLHGDHLIDRGAALPHPTSGPTTRAMMSSAPVVPRPPSASVRYVVTLLRTYDRAVRLEHLVAAARAQLLRAEARVHACDAAARDRAAADAAFRRNLRIIYRDPDAARRAFEAHRGTHGAAPATRLLAERPDAYGALVTVHRAARFGFGHRDDDTPAREAAFVAAGRAATLEASRGGLASPTATRAAFDALAAARGRAERLRGAAHASADRGALAPQIARAMSRLSDADRRDLARLLTPREAALAHVIADTLDDDVRRERGGRTAPRAPASGARGRDHAGTSGARSRHVEAGQVGTLLNRAVAQLAPREYRELRALVTAVRHPGLAVGRTLQHAVRDALLGRDGAER